MGDRADANRFMIFYQPETILDQEENGQDDLKRGKLPIRFKFPYSGFASRALRGRRKASGFLPCERPGPLELQLQVETRAIALGILPARTGMEAAEAEREVFLQPAVDPEIHPPSGPQAEPPVLLQGQSPSLASETANRRPGLNRSFPPRRPDRNRNCSGHLGNCFLESRNSPIP